LFLRRAGESVTSSPIKGTLPRTAHPSALRASVKDVAENIMIVDLVRNDLDRVAVTGTVTLPELLVVRAAPGVWHLVSTVSARVELDVPMAAVLEATFPPASVTGTPKARARQLLSVWEPQRRGVYCGTVGLASPVAGCELNVAIRTVEFGGARSGRWYHRRLRSRRRMGGVPAQGRPDSRVYPATVSTAKPRRTAHAATARPGARRPPPRRRP
jgi:para-aminobenzoate synthetase component 1